MQLPCCPPPYLTTKETPVPRRSHFRKLAEDMDNLLLWAEVRHEQHAKIAGKIAKLHKHVRAVSEELVQAEPTEKLAQCEPDKLRDIQAARPDGPRKIWEKFTATGFANRLKGAWLARAAGCTLGAIVEGWPIEDMEAMAEYSGVDFPPTDYWPVAATPQRVRYGLDRCANYTRDDMKYMPVDDDLTYTLLGLLILEEYGPDFTTKQVGQAWQKYLPMAYTAEKVALDNLNAGVSWKKAGIKNNPYMEWIGADIRSDPWGYAAPGWPEKAAELAYRDAYISHRYGGVYGEMFFAAAIAAAFTVDDPLEACRIGMTEIPAKCRLYKDLNWAFGQIDKIEDFRHARRLVDKRFSKMNGTHTNNNAVLTIFGLALGGLDVTKVIGTQVAMGLDNDCTAATAGSLVGAVVGAKAIDPHWTRPFRGKVRTYMIDREWFTNADIVKRFTTAAKAVWGT